MGKKNKEKTREMLSEKEMEEEERKRWTLLWHKCKFLPGGDGSGYF